MTKCSKCNKEFSDGTKFCDDCGVQTYETVFCPNCGEETSTEFTSCSGCGELISDVPIEEQPVVGIVEERKPRKKTIIFGGIGVVALAVLILVISLFFKGDKINNDEYSIYVKDRELFIVDLNKDSVPWQLTSKFLNSEEVGNDILADIRESIGPFITISRDGKYIFFPDKIGEEDEGINLYYKKVAKPESKAILIDTDIRTYSVNSSATVVTYLKGEEGSLYQCKLAKGSKKMIANEVEAFNVSDDGSKIGYFKSDGNIYFKYANKKKEEKASHISNILYSSDDLKTIYYLKDESLYKQLDGKKDVKIASDVYKVIKIYETGEIYYLTIEGEDTSKKFSFSLCFFDGKESSIITDDFVYEHTSSYYTHAADTPVITYEVYKKSSLENGNHSEGDLISSERYIAVKNIPTIIEQEKKAVNFQINSSGTEAFYIDNISNDKDYGDLYRIPIKDGVVGKAELYDSDVYIENCSFAGELKLHYFKNFENRKGEFYVNRMRAGFDVYQDMIKVYDDSENAFFFTNWSEEKGYGTLGAHRKGESIEVSDKVYSYTTFSDGRIWYLYKRSKDHTGALHEWHSYMRRKIDDDVACVFTVDKSKYRGRNYGWQW